MERELRAIGIRIGDVSAAGVAFTATLDTLLTVVDRIIVLHGGQVLADGTIDQILQSDNEWIKSYFSVRTMIEPHSEPVS